MYRLLVAVSMVALCAFAQQPPRDRCKICLEIADICAKSTSLQEFEHKGHTVCQGLHQDERHECDDLMMHAHQLFEAMHGPNKHTPQQVCEHIHACMPATTTSAPKVDQFFPGECTVCELVIGEVESLVTSSTTEAELEHLLDEACGKIPLFGGDCKSVVNKYVPELLNLLKNKEPPSKVCGQIHLCSGLLKAPKVDQFFPGECTVCELVIGEVEKLVTSSTTEGELEHLLDEACGKIPLFGGDCKSVVNKYVPELLNLLKNKEPPSKVCGQIHLCSGLRKAPQLFSKCSFCEKIVGPVVKGVESNQGVSDIEHVIDATVCPEFEFAAPVCVALCHEFVPKLVDLLKNHHVTGQQLCKDVHLC